MLRKKTEGEAESYVMTIPLMMDASGKKFGKSEGNAIWLDQRKNSPYFVYQYFLNSADADVEKFLRAFTLLEIVEIEEIVAKHNEKPESRYGQRQLANYVIQTLFGKQAAEQAEKISDFLFGSEDKMQMINEFSREEIQALELLVKCGIVDSNGEAKKMIAQGAIYINENKISDISAEFTAQDASNGVLLIRKGKKNYKIAQFID